MARPMPRSLRRDSWTLAMMLKASGSTEHPPCRVPSTPPSEPRQPSMKPIASRKPTAE